MRKSVYEESVITYYFWAAAYGGGLILRLIAEPGLSMIVGREFEFKL